MSEIETEILRKRNRNRNRLKRLRKLPKVRVTRSVVPNMFTFMNLFCGFSAIVYTSQKDFSSAAWFILLAGFFDMFDGIVARMTRSTSEFGVELDSLCDAVSFGVAPSFMVWTAILHQLGNPGLIISALPAIAGVGRLARFNVQLSGFDDKLYFRGMPIPAGALTIVSYVLYFHLGDKISSDNQIPFIIGVVISTSLAMISTVKFDNMPRPSIKVFRERPIFYGIFALGFIAVIISRGQFLFPFMALYVLWGTFRHLYFAFTAPLEDDEVNIS